MLDFFRKYNDHITWWIIGWLCFATIDALARGNYFWGCCDVVLIYFNYKLWKNNQ